MSLVIMDCIHPLSALKVMGGMVTSETNWERGPINFTLLVRNDKASMIPWAIINIRRSRNTSSSKTKQEISFSDDMSSFLLYAMTFTEKYKVPFWKERTVTISRDMERKHFLGAKSASGNERYSSVEKMIVRIKSAMERIKTVPQLESRQYSAKSGVTYLDTAMIINGTEEIRFFILDAAEAYF